MRFSVPTNLLIILGGLTMMSPAAHADGIIISAPTCDNYWMADSPNCSPEQRARAAEAKKKMEAEAAAKAQAAQAEKARLDALAAQEASRLGLGANRMDDARKLVEMREKAAAAAGRPPTPAAAKKCEMKTFMLKVGSGWLDTLPEARAAYQKDANSQCMTRTGATAFSGVPQCETSDHSIYAAMPIGKRPAASPVQLMSRCGGTIICTQKKQVCESVGSGRATAQ